MIDNNTYIQFLRFCLNDSMEVPADINEINWETMLVFAKKHSIIGIIYQGILRAGDKLSIPFNVLVEWIGLAKRIEKHNRLLNKWCVELCDYLYNDGFESCILKGQGASLYYKNPLLRMSGDIDVWVKSLTKEFDSDEDVFVKEVIKYARSHNPKGMQVYIHADFGNFEGVPVELHYRPSFMNSPFYNRRLQKWIRNEKRFVFTNWVRLDGVDDNICIPTVKFNIFYLLSHMYRHLLDEGIGMRQIIDYYYLLKTDSSKGTIKSDIVCTLKYLGLYKFASAVMFILHQILGLEEEYLIVPIDKRRGEFLLEEILRGGNLGKYDTKGFIVTWENPVGSFLRHLERDIRLFRYFPSESLWEPVFRVYHWFWRLRYN